MILTNLAVHLQVLDQQSLARRRQSSHGSSNESSRSSTNRVMCLRLQIAVVEAFKRGVTVRVSLNSIESGVDQYNATTFLGIGEHRALQRSELSPSLLAASIGVPVRTISSPLYAHNKVRVLSLASLKLPGPR